ncbi:glycosyltransferase family 4 protein [Opitutales bacterium]|nr:glycosyltransferase family 4 protein [Opitutales bacterium]
MRVGVVSVQVPFISGGAEFLADGLLFHLKRRGVEAELITLPFKWYPTERILDAMLSARLTDITESNGHTIDRIITLKFPSYYISHPNKVLWLLHQHRQAYDLYDTEFSDLHRTQFGREVVSEIKFWDESLLPDHQLSFSISHRVSERLMRYNQLGADPLYPPPTHPNYYHCKKAEPFILVPGRLSKIKRQKLIIEAIREVPFRMNLVFIGQDDETYAKDCKDFVLRNQLQGRVTFNGRVTEEQKIDLFARCFAVYNGVYDEDYGYVTPEAFLSEKPVITHDDSGGPLEFVVHQENGLICKPESKALAESLMYLQENPNFSKEMGQAGKDFLKHKNLNWDHVIDRLLS